MQAGASECDELEYFRAAEVIRALISQRGRLREVRAMDSNQACETPVTNLGGDMPVPIGVLHLKALARIEALEAENAALKAQGPVLSEDEIAHLYVAEMACGMAARAAKAGTINQAAFVEAGQFVGSLLERAKR